MRGASLICAGILLCRSGTAAAAAAPPPICADRPGKATATCLVEAGHVQIETGIADWTLQKAGGERDTSLAIAETTLKYGISSSANVEVDMAPWQRSISRFGGVRDSASGFGDVNVLYKQRLTAADAALQIAALPFIKIPTANHELGNRKWEGGFLLPIGYSIPKTPLAIALTPEIDAVADADGHGHHAAMAQVVSLAWAATDKLNLSAELWAAWDWDPSGTTHQVSADGAIAYLVGNDVQLDAGANFGLNRETPDVELYTGIAIRF